MPVLYPPPAAPAAPHVNAKLNLLHLWRRNLRLKLRNRLLLLHIPDTGKTAALPLLRRLASGPVDDSVDHTSGRFSVPVSGVRLWVAARERGRLSAGRLLAHTSVAAVHSRLSALDFHA